MSMVTVTRSSLGSSPMGIVWGLAFPLIVGIRRKSTTALQLELHGAQHVEHTSKRVRFPAIPPVAKFEGAAERAYKRD